MRSRKQTGQLDVLIDWSRQRVGNHNPSNQAIEVCVLRPPKYLRRDVSPLDLALWQGNETDRNELSVTGPNLLNIYLFIAPSSPPSSFPQFIAAIPPSS